jgi:hypothetical protein
MVTYLKSCVFRIDTKVEWPYSPNQKEALGSPSLNSSLRPSQLQ